jgi:2-keto-4-pentenoate hydratase
MDEAAFAAARDALAAARREGRALDTIPDAWLPADLTEAYRLQQAVAGLLGQTRGWKVSALSRAAQEATGVDRPTAAPLLAPWFTESPATLSVAQWPAWIKLECEYAFELQRDLPPRDTPYTRADVEAAIRTMRIGIEVCAARVPPRRSALLELGDALNNGAYVVGAEVADWRTFAYADHPIVLSLRDARGEVRELARGNARPILGGDPIGAVVAMANTQQPDPRGLVAGQTVTTGTCTGAVPLDPAAAEAVDVIGDFGALGTVEVRFLAKDPA